MLPLSEDRKTKNLDSCIEDRKWINYRNYRRDNGCEETMKQTDNIYLDDEEKEPIFDWHELD